MCHLLLQQQQKENNDKLRQLIIVYNPSNEEKMTTSFADLSSFAVHQKKERFEKKKSVTWVEEQGRWELFF